MRRDKPKGSVTRSLLYPDGVLRWPTSGIIWVTIISFTQLLRLNEREHFSKLILVVSNFIANLLRFGGVLTPPFGESPLAVFELLKQCGDCISSAL